jgi:hypothetical protein
MALISTNPRRRSPVILAAGVLLTATLALGAFPGSASAQDHRGWDGRHEWHHGYYGGGYYRAPPVVYGSPYYYAPPPVVYGPGFGLNINIR